MGSARTGSTWTPRGTATWARSRWGYGSDGKRIQRKVSGKTKQEVRAKLQALHQELNSGVRSSSTYTVREAVDDLLREGLDGTSGQAAEAASCAEFRMAIADPAIRTDK